MSRARLLAVLAIACVGAGAVGAAGCGHGGGAAPPPAVPPPAAADIPPPDTIPGTFAVRQKLSARSDKGSGSFEAVLQKQPGKLVLLALTPYGSRAFLLEQTPSDVKLTSYLPRELPFPPTFILMDVHRVFGQWLGPPLGDGERAGVVRAELVRERWRAGMLIERTFAPADNRAVPTTTITYAGRGPAGLAAHVTLASIRFSYTLTIETLPL
jgi:hypothetical protein